ncbi:MAG: PilZ domain-containing protein [Desulfamplus sp.]|nr:PilZ domain-containing protein [Desulfamplus sp.]
MSKAVFICPDCGFEKQFDASPLKNKDKNIKIKCRCGKITEMEIEFRRHFRKDVELFGTCLIRKTDKSCDIIVRNLSMQGIRFELLHIYSKYMSVIDLGDILELEFKLDTKQEEVISKRCIVRTKTDKYIGAEFQDDNFSKRLGFYLG